MAKKQVWTVRVVNWQDRNSTAFALASMGTTRNHLPGVWLEQLRYMGHAKELASYDDRNVIELYCPESTKHDTKVWAEQNAARMRSFGIDAAAAPQWMDDLYNRPLGTPSNDSEHLERFNRPKVAR